MAQEATKVTKPEEPAFNIHAVDSGCYHVYIRLSNILTCEKQISALSCWFLSRSSTDRISIIWQNGMMGTFVNTVNTLANFSTLFEAINNSCAYENIGSVITQVFSGLAAYMMLVTNKVHWSNLGILYFDGWKRGRKSDEVGIALKSRYEWVDSLLDRAVLYGWLTGEQAESILDGKAVWTKKA